jgi:ribosomal protein L22
MLELRKTKNKTVIFLHIPKTAGTTLHSIIERQYPSSVVHTIDGRRVHQSIAQLKDMSEEKRSKIKCLKGHIPFGLHEYLPGSSAYITFKRSS